MSDDLQGTCFAGVASAGIVGKTYITAGLIGITMIPPNAITLGGSPLTLGGATLTLG